MNSFRISTSGAREERKKSLPPDSKSRGAGAAKVALVAVSLAAVLLTGCRHTPSYSGPPNLIVHVLMKKWVIVPDRIVVPQDAHVELIVTSADVEHGIGVPALAINEPVQPGRTTVVRFLAEKPGTYPMRCSVACGRGHDKMTGVIVIVPKAKEPVVHK